MTVLVISLVSIAVWNFFAPDQIDVSERVIDKLLTTLNSDNLAGIGVEAHYSATSAISRDGGTKT